MPFYLYGTGQEIHIDHVLLQAPNAQVSAGEVTVELIEGSESGFTSGLNDGLIAVADTLPEHLMQPFPSYRLKYIFHPGAKLAVSVYNDPKATDSQEPDLCVRLGEPIARATIILGANTFVDEYMINLDAPIVISRSPKKGLTIPETTSVSQDHPLFRGYGPSGPTDRHDMSTRNTESWREVWDRALAGRQFAAVDPRGKRNSTDSLASGSDCDDHCPNSVALGRPPIPLFRD
jgi:hypothetical protein